MAIDWSVVRENHVFEACQLYDEGKELPPRSARNTFLVLHGRKYPAKHIRGLAYRLATGRTLNPSADYSGGLETVRFFRNLGFDVEYGRYLVGGDRPRRSDVGRKVKLRQASCVENKAKPHTDPQKEALKKLLQELFGSVVTEAKFSWLVVPDRPSMDHSLAEIVDALASHRNYQDFYSPGESLSVDYFIPSLRLIVEYDERQHFTIPRAIALRNYPEGLRLRFDTYCWIQACEAIRASDSTPYYRDEQRAFYDSLRDILASRNGMPLIRLQYGDVDWTALDAKLQLNRLVAQGNQFSAESAIRQDRPTSQTMGFGSTAFTVALIIPKVWSPSTDGLPRPLDVPRRFEPLIPSATDFAGESIDLAVFPEAYIRHDDKERLELLGGLAQQLNAYLLVGASKSHDRRNADWETLLLFEPDRSWKTIYHKHATAGAVAFEFDDWNPEHHLPVFSIRNVTVGCTICHDSYLGLLQRYLAQRGAKLWINPSYDNVIHEKWESIHRLRAVENHVVSLCTLHDNYSRKRRRRIRPFGFIPEGRELFGYPPDRPSQARKLSECTESGIYIVKCPLNTPSARANPKLLPETGKQPFQRRRKNRLLRVSLIDRMPHAWSNDKWLPLEQAAPIEIDGTRIALGLVYGNELFDIAVFVQLLEEIYNKDPYCKPLLWNQWDELPTRPEQLVDMLLGRTLEFFSCLVLSDKTTIYEVTEIAGGTKTMRRICVNDSECEVDLSYSLGLWNSFKITWDGLTDVRTPEDFFVSFAPRYLSLV